MNYHFFFWDDKFVDGFIETASIVSNNEAFVYVFEKPAKYVKSNKGIFAPTNSKELKGLLSHINEDDKVFLHPLIASDIMTQIPQKTKIYAVFWGGEFLNITNESGVDNIFGNLLYEPLTKKYMRSISNSYRRHYMKTYIKAIIRDKNLLEGLSKLLYFPIKYYSFFNSNLRDYILEKKRLINKLTAICHWNALDIDLLMNLFDEKITCEKFFYGASKDLISSEIIYNPQKSELDPLIFFVGNSDTPTNNHIDIFEILKRFRNENIKIYSPLNYHNQEYAKYIASIGRKMFGEKFLPLFEFIPKDKYLELMDTVDICIMNHRRTQAAGNINSFLAKGKKVYLNPISTIYSFLRSNGVEVLSTHLLLSATTEDLRKRQEEAVIKKNLEVLRGLFGVDAALESYKNLLIK